MNKQIIIPAVLWLITLAAAKLSMDTGDIDLVAFCCSMYGFVTCRCLMLVLDHIKQKRNENGW